MALLGTKAANGVLSNQELLDGVVSNGVVELVAADCTVAVEELLGKEHELPAGALTIPIC